MKNRFLLDFLFSCEEGRRDRQSFELRKQSFRNLIQADIYEEQPTIAAKPTKGFKFRQKDSPAKEQLATNYERCLGGPHSTVVAFALLTQRPRV